MFLSRSGLYISEVETKDGSWWKNQVDRLESWRFGSGSCDVWFVVCDLWFVRIETISTFWLQNNWPSFWSAGNALVFAIRCRQLFSVLPTAYILAGVENPRSSVQIAWLCCCPDRTMSLIGYVARF
jgi:hypothetical protein